MTLLGAALGPIGHNPWPRRGSRFAEQAREIGQALIAYSNDHNNNYPYGNSSTEVFQKLLDKGYVKDPSIFYIALPGKIEPSPGQRLKPENVSFDVTLGMKWWHIPRGLPLVFSTGYHVTYAPGASAVPISQPSPTYSYTPPWLDRLRYWQWPSEDMSARGIAVFSTDRMSRFMPFDAPTNPDGSISNFISPDFRPDGKVYRQLTPDLPSGLSATPPPVSVSRPPTPTPPVANQPWTNMAGVTFIPAGAEGVLFSIWDVRVKDFAAFVDATGYDATVGMFRNGTVPWNSHGITWKHPGFTQSQDDPVVKVSWNDAEAYCKWLTDHEHNVGKLAPNQYYQLPTDAEWSKAVGLDEVESDPPWKKSNKIRQIFPWGSAWPPPAGSANYDATPDGYGSTSPVGAFPANKFGLFDMGGNVWQWCEDPYGDKRGHGILRGGGWEYQGGCVPFLSYRSPEDPGMRRSDVGFRVVVIVSPEANQAQR